MKKRAPLKTPAWEATVPAESACLFSLRPATGVHEQKISGVEVAMEFLCRFRVSGDVLAF